LNVWRGGKVKTKFLADPVLVGRDRELEELKRYLNSAFEGKGSTVFISGEAGSGKTRLAHEFLSIAKEKGAVVLAGWCLSGAAVPYFPFVEAFASSMSSNGENNDFNSQHLGMKTWLAGPGSVGELERHEFLNPQAWKDQAFAAVTNELLIMATSKPTILFIDDIHWADSASLALLLYIARAVGSERILLLATFRSEEISVKAEGKLHPLVEALRLMGREGIYEEIKLGNLTEADIGKIAESMLGGSLASVMVEKLAKETLGSPLFVVESLRTMYGQGSLVQEEGQWRFIDERVGFPAKVKDVILRRLDLLNANQKGMLDAASIIGEKFDPKLLAAVVSQDHIEVLKTLNAIERATLLVLGEGDGYRFNHAKIREMLYDEIPPLLKREYHSRIGEKIEVASREFEEFPFSDIAYHYIQAGNKEKSVKHSLAAGQDALIKFSNLEAIKHFSYVMQALEKDATCTKERSIALEGLGDAYYAISMFEDAIEAFDSLASSTTGTTRLRACRKEMEVVWHKDQDYVRLTNLVKKAKEYGAVDRLENARVRFNEGRAIIWLDMKEALKYYEEAQQVFEEEYSLLDVAWGLMGGTGATRVLLGTREDKGLGEILRGIVILQELGDIRGEILAWRYMGVECFSLSGLFQEFFAHLANIFRIGERIGDFASLSYGWTKLSDVSAMSGNFDEAISRCLKALEYSEKTDALGIQCKIYGKLAKLYALKGDLENAEVYFNKLKRIPKEIRLHPINIFEFAYAESTFFAVTNQWTEAYQAFKQANEQFPNCAGVKFYSKWLHSWLLNRQGKTEEAKIFTDEAIKILEAVGKNYEHANVQAHLMARREVFVGEEFEMRLDFVNVGRKPGVVVKIEDLVPYKFTVVTPPSHGGLQTGNLELKEKSIGPFQVVTVKLRAKASKTGAFQLQPRMIFVDDLGEAKTCTLEIVNVNVKPTSSPTEKDNAMEILTVKLEFKSEATQKAFDFLVSSFREDYIQRKLTQERSGWRTMTDIVKKGNVSKYSVYGSSNNLGRVITELQKNGLVETRMFIGERGRGGKVFKVRVDNEKEIVRRHIAQKCR